MSVRAIVLVILISCVCTWAQISVGDIPAVSISAKRHERSRMPADRRESCLPYELGTNAHAVKTIPSPILADSVHHVWLQSKLSESELYRGLPENQEERKIDGLRILHGSKNMGRVSTSPSGQSTWLGGWGTGGCTSGQSWWYRYILKPGESISWKLDAEYRTADYDLYLRDYPDHSTVLAWATSTSYPDFLDYTNPSSSSNKYVYLEVRYFDGNQADIFYIMNVRRPTTPSGHQILSNYAFRGYPRGNPTDGVEGYHPYPNTELSHWYRWLMPHWWADSVVYLRLTNVGGGYDYDLTVYDSNLGAITWANGVSYPDVTGGIDGSLYANQILYIEVMVFDQYSAEYRIDFDHIERCPFIEVTSPNGGECWIGDNAHDITWTSNGVSGNVKIELYKGGSYHTTIISNTANDGIHTCIVPSNQTPGTDYKVKISSVNEPSIYDFSDNDFSICREIIVQEPDESEFWRVSTDELIEWTTSGIGGNVRIDYSTDAGMTYEPITENTIDDGGHSWNNIPPPPTNKAKIRIEHLDCAVNVDGSDIFEIVGTDPDQNKLGNWDDGWMHWVLYFDDILDPNGYHDPGEPVYTTPGATMRKDLSCWMASAANLLEQEGYGSSYYWDWSRNGGAQSPESTSWKDERWADGVYGNTNPMTFDDYGSIFWPLRYEGHGFAGPIRSVTEHGAWPEGFSPIDWCQDQLDEGHAVGLGVWWYKPDPPPNGTFIGHAITLWGIDKIDEDHGTVLITDSDDGEYGSLVKDYTYIDNDWVIENMWDTRNVHVKYATAYNLIPAAYIDNISPNPAQEGQDISFAGHGDDQDGFIVHYTWQKGENDTIGIDPSFIKNDLPAKIHTISFHVQDNDSMRSDKVTQQLTVNNEPPTAYIDSITPNPAYEGEEVLFGGHSYEVMGNVVAYNWRSDIDGQLSTDSAFSTSSLSADTHVIYFKVQDDEGAWSDEDDSTLVIEPIPDIAVTPDTLHFTYDSLAQDTVATMFVYNTDNGLLDVMNITWNEPWIVSVDPTAFTVTSGDSQAVNVTITRDDLPDGTHDANLSISSNDPDENPYLEPVELTLSISPDTLWTQTYDYQSGWDEARQVQQTTDGGYIVVGQTEDPYADYLLLKIDANGDTMWVRTYDWSDSDRGRGVQQTTDGGYIVAGTRLMKTDSLGDTLWTKSYDANAVQQTTDSGYIVVGSSLIKTDINGDMLWEKPYGGNSVEQTLDDKGYIITGHTSSSGVRDEDVYLIKTDSLGDTLWTKTYGGTNYDCGHSVNQTFDGGYIIAGETHSFGAGSRDFYLVKTDEYGDTVWTKTYGGSASECAYSVRQTFDGGYIMAGYTRSYGQGFYDVYVIRTDATGSVMWSKTCGGTDEDKAQSVQQLDDGDYILAGYTWSFDSSGDVYLIKIEGEFPPPDIAVVPDTLLYTYTETDTDTVKTMTIHNVGDYELRVFDITSAMQWVVSIESTSFDVVPGGSQNVTVIVSGQGLASDTYYGDLEIFSNDSDEYPYLEPMRLFVDVPEPDIAVAPDTLDYDYIGTISDTVQNMIFKNTGELNLDITDITKNEPWIVSITPTVLTVSPGDSQIVLVTVSGSGLENGLYFDSLSILSNDPNESPYYEPVRLTIDIPKPYIEVMPTLLEFTYYEADRDTVQYMYVGNKGDTVLEVANITGNESWIASIDPIAFSVLPNDSQKVTVIVTRDTLLSGFYADSLLIVSNDPDEDSAYEPLKFTVFPNASWCRTYGGGGDDHFYSCQQTADSGYIITGYTHSFGEGTPSMSYVYFVKTDADGDTAWTNIFTSAPTSYADYIRCLGNEGYSVQQTWDGGYIVAGYSRRADEWQDEERVYLIKTDGSGELVWHECHGEYWGQSRGYSVVEMPDTSYIVSGYQYHYDYLSGLLLLKRRSSTNFTKVYGGVTEVGLFQGHCVKQTSDGGFIVVGYTNSLGAGGDDVWLLKTDANGDTLWTRTYGGTGSEKGFSVEQTNDGGYIITGHTTSFGSGGVDVYLIKADSLGDTIWTKTYGGANNDYGCSVQQTVDGGYIVAGRTASFGAGSYDVWLIKTDENGDTLWTETFGGTGTDEGWSVDQTIDGGYVVAGFTNSFGAGGYDAFLLQTRRGAHPPSAPYLTRVEKSGDDIVLSWDAVANDTTGAPIIPDHYVVYRDTSPSFVPTAVDSIGAVSHPQTEYTDVGVGTSGERYYYLVKTVDEVHVKSKKSNMGYVFCKSLNENAAATDKNRTSLPWDND